MNKGTGNVGSIFNKNNRMKKYLLLSTNLYIGKKFVYIL